MEGDLAVLGLSDLSVWLGERKLSGRLHVVREARTMDFDIEDGMVVRASSNDPRDYFGQFLIHYGLISEDQLQRAFETQHETSVLLGRILVMIGTVPEEQVIQILRVKFSENMLLAFTWTDGHFEFRTGVAPTNKPAIEVAVPVIDIHREGVRRAEVLKEFERLVPSRQSRLRVIEGRAPPQLSKTSMRARILALAREHLSIESIALELHTTRHQLAARIVQLLKAGIVEVHEPSTELDPPSPTPDIRPDQQVRRDLAELSTRVPILATSLPLANVKPPLSAKQRYLLARVDGHRTIQAIIQVSPMKEAEALVLLRELERDGLIRLSP